MPPGRAWPTATVEAGGRTLLAEHAALEEKPGSGSVTTAADTDENMDKKSDTDGGAK
jgi:multicomponent Na+:H+ antiporter subunit C